MQHNQLQQWVIFKTLYYHILLSKWPKSMINKITSCFYLNLLPLLFFVLRTCYIQNMIKKLFNGDLLGNTVGDYFLQVALRLNLFFHSPNSKITAHTAWAEPQARTLAFYKAVFLNDSGVLGRWTLNSWNATSLHPYSHIAAILRVTSQHESTWFKYKDALYTQNGHYILSNTYISNTIQNRESYLNVSE